MLIKNFFNKILKKKKFLIIYRFGSSLGDQLCLTAVIKKLNKNLNYKIILFVSYPEFFLNNPNIYKIFYFRNLLIIKILNKFFKILESDYFLEYRAIESSDDNKYFISKKDGQHLANAHASHFKFYDSKENSDLSCEFFFSDQEIILLEKKYRFKKKFALVQSESKVSFTPNKNWFPERFNEVIKSINFIDWIQIGPKNDYKIDDTVDMRAELNIRELAYIVSKSEFILCLEGFLNHLASCFQKKTFIITSGFIPSSVISYKNTYFIKSQHKPLCDPCYLLTKCPVDNYPCMTNISSIDVINFIRTNLKV